MAYREAAIKSAQIYYKYLTDNNRGIVSCQVINITQQDDFYILTLAGNLFLPDTVQIKINNEIYSKEQIMPFEYDGKRHTLHTTHAIEQ